MNGTFRNENSSTLSNSLLQTTSRCTPSPASTCSPKPTFSTNGDFSNGLKKKVQNSNQIKSLENVFNHHLGQYLVNNNAYLNNSQSNFSSLALDRSTGNLDCLANLNNLTNFRNNLIPTSTSLINSTDFQFTNNLKSNLHDLGLFNNLNDANNNSKQLNNELNKSLDVNLVNEEELMNDEDDSVSIDVDGADDEFNDTPNIKSNYSKFNSIDDNIQKNLIKSLAINSEANSIKNELKSDLLDCEFKTNFKAINQEQKSINKTTISSLSSSSSSSSTTDAQYNNINSFLYPHWLLSCTQ